MSVFLKFSQVGRKPAKNNVCRPICMCLFCFYVCVCLILYVSVFGVSMCPCLCPCICLHMGLCMKVHDMVSDIFSIEHQNGIRNMILLISVFDPQRSDYKTIRKFFKRLACWKCLTFCWFLGTLSFFKNNFIRTVRLKALQKSNPSLGIYGTS